MNGSPVGAWLSGFGLSASLILALGAQNAFVLRHGLRRERVFLIALVSSLCDATLILLGTAGVGRIISHHPSWARGMGVVGALFLVCYGLKSLHSAMREKRPEIDVHEGRTRNTAKVALSAMGFSLLNPHVYLDTVVLIGSLSAQYDGRLRVYFAFGAMSVSFLWFFGLAYGARFMAPLFRKPSSWRIFDGAIAATMFVLAASLLS